MDFYIHTSKKDELTIGTKLKLKKMLEEKGHKENITKPNYIFTVGGDGTVLDAFQKFLPIIDDVYFVGIHTGKLGFYTDWLPKELEKLVEEIEKNDKPRIARYPLIEVTLEREGIYSKEHVLNEMSVVNPYVTQVLDIYINGEIFETFRGTGICISAPGGSSAYNKSLGGTIIPPDIPSMQVTEIASINSNAYRSLGAPFVLRESDVLKLVSHDLSRTAVTFDNRHLDCGLFEHIECRVSKKTLKFARFKDIKFWHRVKRDFL